MRFKQHNNFSTDEDMTTDQVKRFRTWLAKTLLELDCKDDGTPKYSFYDEDTTEMLHYYARGMYNDVIKSLDKIPAEYVVSDLKSTRFGCDTCSDLSSPYKAGGEKCNPVESYRKYLYKKMTKVFSDTDFWLDIPTNIIALFKQYIDNIIRLNLPLEKSPYVSQFSDCSCLDSGQMAKRDILNRLSKALFFIIMDSAHGNKNFIKDAFMDWAIDLYENMEWG